MQVNPSDKEYIFILQASTKHWLCLFKKKLLNEIKSKLEKQRI